MFSFYNSIPCVIKLIASSPIYDFHKFLSIDNVSFLFVLSFAWNGKIWNVSSIVDNFDWNISWSYFAISFGVFFIIISIYINLKLKPKLNFINFIVLFFRFVWVACLLRKRNEWRRRTRWWWRKNSKWIVFYLNALSFAMSLSLSLSRTHAHARTQQNFRTVLVLFDFFCVINSWEIWSNLSMIIFSM